jgi:hypothetical protein
LKQIEPNEPITRYILSRSHFSPTKKRVKARALEPSPRDNRTSVFRIRDLKQTQVWEIGWRDVAKVRKRTLHARADLSVSTVLEIGLHVEPEEPPPRHANIQGWPESKSEKMSLSQRLAAEAVLVVNPD